MPNPYVNSNYPRIPDDYYPTIDPRCVYGFLEHFRPTGMVIDPCAPQGSGIVDTLTECGVAAAGRADAFAGPWFVEWIVCNPPYKRGLVDEVIWRQIERIMDREVDYVAMLLRSNFAYARVHDELFKNSYYFGEIKLRFRPWWVADHSKQPIHNFSWHIWSKAHKNFGRPVLPYIMFADGIKPIERALS